MMKKKLQQKLTDAAWLSSDDDRKKSIIKK